MRKRRSIKKSLVLQLRAKGIDTPFYIDMVEKYMDLWDDLQKMREDLNERGRIVTAISASGNEYTKENENIKLIPAYIKQMQAMLDGMGITADSITPEGGAGDDL